MKLQQLFDHISGQETNITHQNNFWVINRPLWEYHEYLQFLQHAVPLIHHDPKLAFFLITSHPHCFTHGYGLQKSKTIKADELVHFEKAKDPMPFPLYQIKRGGGITFHHPGQLIFYPIFNITQHKTSITKVMLKLIQSTQKSLEDLFGIRELHYKNKFLGLWHKNQKLASVGMGLDRFVGLHGLALNLVADQKMQTALQGFFPCGLGPEIYTHLNKILQDKKNANEYYNLIAQKVQKDNFPFL